MFRSVLIIVSLFIFLIITLPFLLLTYIIGLFSLRAKRETAMFLARIWARMLIVFSGSKVEVIGRKNILKKEAVLFVGNHRSLFDIPAFYGYTNKVAGFVAKKEIDKVPIMNLWMRCLGCLFIDRSSPRAGIKTILKGIEMIKAGDSMFIFPEGTRSKTGEMGHFKPGSLKLAEKTGCPIIPVALIGTDKIFESSGKKKRIRGSKCKLIFGEPVRQEDIPEDQRKNCAEFIKGKIQKLLDEYDN